jgi:hypothetical protein
VQGVRSEIVPAATGLPTLRVQLQTTARWTAANSTLSFTDENYPSRIGWKEIVFHADPPLAFPDGNLYEHDRSHLLTTYPDDLLSSAPDVVSARVRIATAGRKESISPMFRKIIISAVIALCVAAPLVFQLSYVSASSHREAP